MSARSAVDGFRPALRGARKAHRLPAARTSRGAAAFATDQRRRDEADAAAARADATRKRAGPADPSMRPRRSHVASAMLRLGTSASRLSRAHEFISARTPVRSRIGSSWRRDFGMTVPVIKGGLTCECRLSRAIDFSRRRQCFACRAHTAFRDCGPTCTRLAVVAGGAIPEKS